MRPVPIVLALAILAAACSGEPAAPEEPSGSQPAGNTLSADLAMPGGDPMLIRLGKQE